VAISYSRYYQRDSSIRARESISVSERRHEPVFPGFREMAAERRVLTTALVSRRVELGLSQTEVAARMGTSQSAVARLESGDADIRLSTLERYAAALGQRLDWKLEERDQ
jgi:ribosome-binding protein aMBF1 (putative translation factor)